MTPWMFHRDGNPITDYYGAWNKASRLSGLADRVAHNLRRTAVRNLGRTGVPRVKMTGHKTESVCRRYAIVDEGILRESTKQPRAVSRIREETCEGCAPGETSRNEYVAQWHGRDAMIRHRTELRSYAVANERTAKSAAKWRPSKGTSEAAIAFLDFPRCLNSRI